jgi:virulence factor Mce-like protein
MNRKRTVMVIAFIVAAGLAVAAFTVTRVSGPDQMTVRAQFEDTVGLYEGNAVSVLGMRVGTVESIVSHGSYVDVKLAIDPGVDVPADVLAVTVNTSVLTDRHVELTPAYTGGAKLKSGDVIGLARTRTPVEFDRTLAMIDKLSVSLRGDGKGHGPLSDFITASNAVLSGNGENLRATLGELSQALQLGPDNGAYTAKDIQSIVKNLAELSQAAADNDSAIREFGSNIRQVSDILADEQLGSGDTGAKINEIISISASLLESNRDKLKGTVANGNDLSKAMVDNRREVAESFDLLPLVLDNIYNLVDTNAGAARGNFLLDKTLFDSQLAKELCNLAGAKQLGCATGTIADFGPDFGLSMMLDLMTGKR